MFHEDDTFDFYEELIALAEEFCQGWVQRQGTFEDGLERALVLNFALCTIKHDLEQILDLVEHQPIFQGLSPRMLYERGGYGEESLSGLDDRDIEVLVKQALKWRRRR